MAQCEQCDIDVPEDSLACPQCGSSVGPELDELLGTDVLGRYRIVRLIAEGGMGRVYLAEQAVGTVVRRVAVKVLRRQLGSDKQLVSRFSREAETLVRLTHPNTVQLFDFGALPDGTLGLVMEYVEGHSLARELLNGPLTPTRVERLLAQACGALQEAHAHGIVHRDLKPDNLLIADRVGHGDFVKVLDFGIAKVSSAHEAIAGTKLTQQGMMVGTPPYMSPEQFSGESIDARSDVYSLGVIAFEMLTARLPFTAKTPWGWASRHLTGEPEPLPLLPGSGLLPRHARAIRDALAKRADDRPPTVADFLSRFTSDADITTEPTVPRKLHAASSSALALVPVDPPKHKSQPGGSAASVAAGTLSSSPFSTTSITRPSGSPWTVVGLVLGGLAIAVALGLAGLRARSNVSPTPPAMPEPHGAAATLALALADTGAPSPLPRGAGLPEQARGLVQSPRPHHEAQAADSQARSREHKSMRQLHNDLAPSAITAAPGASPEERVVDTASRPRAPAARAEEAKKGATVPDDLSQRIAQIRSAATMRPEQAVGLFQAAAGRYGSHSALQPVRAQLATRGESRINELIGGGQCAQAQALYRALRGISSAGKAASAFGRQCAVPP